MMLSPCLSPFDNWKDCLNKETSGNILALLSDKYQVTITDLNFNNNSKFSRPITSCNRDDLFYAINETAIGLCILHGSWRSVEAIEGKIRPIIHKDILYGADTGYSVDSALKEVLVDRSKQIDDIHSKITTFLEGKKKEDTSYTRLKNITNYSAYSENDTLFIPLYNEDKITGLQIISPTGSKRFKKHSICANSYHIVSNNYDRLVFVTEGYATACTVAKAVPNSMVICAFSLHNLPPVCKRFIKSDYSRVVIACLERDLKNSDTNRVLKEALKGVTACAIPRFINPKSKGTDFNDLATEEGIKQVQIQLNFINLETMENSPIPLGYTEGNEFYLFSRLTRTYVKFTDSLKAYTHFLFTSSFLQKHFPHTSKEYNDKQATAYYSGLCRAVGRFNPTLVRGLGVFKEYNKLLFNNGNLVYQFEDNRLVSWDNQQSSYVYKSDTPLFDDLSSSKPLDVKDIKELGSALCSLDWEDSQLGIVLLGWMVQSTLCGITDWRTHLWILGDTSTGKSYIRSEIFKKIFGYANFVDSAFTTARGILRCISHSAVPVIHDEAEGSSANALVQMKQIMEMHRQSCEGKGGQINIAKQTSSGVNNYHIRHSVCNLSIRSTYPTAADSDRFLELHLKRGDWDSKFSQANNFFSKINSDFSARFLLSCLSKADDYLKNYKDILPLVEEKYRGRYTYHRFRCITSIVAGAYTILELNDKEDFMDKLLPAIENSCLENSVEIDGDEDQLGHVLSMFTPKKWGLPEGTSFKEMIVDYSNHSAMKALGLKYDKASKKLKIKDSSRVLGDLHKYNDQYPIAYKFSDLGVSGIEKCRFMMNDVRGYRGVSIDLSKYLDE